MVKNNQKKTLEIKIFTQSYREALESGIVGTLECIGMVEGYLLLTEKERIIPPVFEEVKQSLKEAAEEVKANYVFGIDYKFQKMDDELLVLATGDAYRNKK